MSLLGENKIGRVSISNNLLSLDKAMSAFMSQVIVLRAERLWGNDVTEYLALSEQFDPIEYGQAIPEYRAIVNELRIDGDDEVRHSIIFEKMV